MELKDNIIANVEKLPENLQTEILHYSEYLLNRYTEVKTEKITKGKRGGIGILKGKIWMSDDFDQPLKNKPVSISPEKGDDKPHGYGSWAGDILMSDDFDEPLEDLAEYM